MSPAPRAEPRDAPEHRAPCSEKRTEKMTRAGERAREENEVRIARSQSLPACQPSVHMSLALASRGILFSASAAFCCHCAVLLTRGGCEQKIQRKEHELRQRREEKKARGTLRARRRHAHLR